MADTAIAITAGSGTNVDTRTESTNNNHRQVVVIGDPSTNAGVAPVDATNGLKVDASGVTLTVAAHNVTNAGTFATQAAQSGTWTVQPGNTANTTAWKVDGSAVTQPVSISGNQAVNVTQIGGNSVNVGAGTGGSATQRVIVDSSQIGTVQTTAQPMSTGYTLVALPTNQSWSTGMSPKGFSAAFTTVTRPANTTAYSAGDSISNNATAGSVTALSATVSDTNDDPITLTDILITSTDTGLAGKRIRAYVYNSDPTANTGVVGGDNAAFSNKVAGYVGSFSGVLETGFSDGTVGRLIPSYNDSTASPSQNASAGGVMVVKPGSGAKTLWVQYQTLDAFTPSANSTTITGTVRGYQARAS